MDLRRSDRCDVFAFEEWQIKVFEILAPPHDHVYRENRLGVFQACFCGVIKLDVPSLELIILFFKNALLGDILHIGFFSELFGGEPGQDFLMGDARFVNDAKHDIKNLAARRLAFFERMCVTVYCVHFTLRV